MKRILLTLLGLVLVLGLFAATGYAGYRFGYAKGAQATANGDTLPRVPELRRFDHFGPRHMPNFGPDREFHRGFPLIGFGFFPLMFLGRLIMLALMILFVFWLFTRSGWRLTRQTTETAPPPTENE